MIRAEVTDSGWERCRQRLRASSDLPAGDTPRFPFIIPLLSKMEIKLSASQDASKNKWSNSYPDIVKTWLAEKYIHRYNHFIFLQKRSWRPMPFLITVLRTVLGVTLSEGGYSHLFHSESMNRFFLESFLMPSFSLGGCLSQLTAPLLGCLFLKFFLEVFQGDLVNTFLTSFLHSIHTSKKQPWGWSSEYSKKRERYWWGLGVEGILGSPKFPVFTLTISAIPQVPVCFHSQQVIQQPGRLLLAEVSKTA